MSTSGVPHDIADPNEQFRAALKSREGEAAEREGRPVQSTVRIASDAAL